MRLGFALACALPVVTAGCSLIYNPNNIDKPDPDALQPIDAEIIVDANPDGIEITAVNTPVITEGQGVDGSRRAVVVVTGDNILAGATIQLVDHTTHLELPSLVLGGTGEVQVAANHKMIAVPVTVSLDANDADIGLDVWVTQLVNGAPKTVKLPAEGDTTSPAPLTLHGLPVIDDATMTLTIDTLAATGSNPATRPFETVYAKLNIKALKVTGQHPLVLRTISSLSIADTVAIDAKPTAGSPATPGTPGVAGALGGDGGAGNGPCGGGKGANGVLLTPPTPPTSGGGGGFASDGTCTVTDANLTDVTQNLGSGGGAGGASALGAAGAAGGSSGGTIQIDSGSTLSLAGGVSAKGAAGAAGVNGGAAGGAGSGGAVLLRARGMLVANAVDVSSGGGASNGRIRFDSGVETVAITPAPEAYRGPALTLEMPEILLEPRPSLTVFGQPGADLKLFIDGLQNDGSPSTRVISVNTGNGANTINLADGQNLFRGVNTICAQVDGAISTAQRPEARDCIDVTYILQPGQ